MCEGMKKMCMEEAANIDAEMEGASLCMAPNTHEATIMELSGYGESPDNPQS